MHIHDKVQNKEMTGQEKSGRTKVHHTKEGISRSFTKYINNIVANLETGMFILSCELELKSANS